MDHLHHREFLAHFPWDKYPEIRPNQREALDVIGKVGGSVTLELPTGSGKTGIGYTFLKTLAAEGEGPLFYVAPTKAIVDQVRQMHPDVEAVYGRNEYRCLYYPGEDLKADEIPCLSLVDCPHRVNQETGETKEPGVVPCPYYQAKYQAKQARIVVSTVAFYLFTQLFSKEWKQPAGLVIDEAHQIARVFRQSLSYEITDWHLRKSVELLERIEAEPEAEQLSAFLTTMIAVLRRKPSRAPTLLEPHEIQELIDTLRAINAEGLRSKVGQAVASGSIDPVKDRVALKKLEELVYDLGRYIRSFAYSLPTGERHPLNYTTYAYSEKEPEGREKAQYRLIIRAYYVAPLVQKLLSPFTVSYSATIGDASVFGFETGIKAPFYTFPSAFPSENTRIFLPTDTPNLATKNRIRQEPTKVLRRIAKACRRFGKNGIRSLVVVVSELERQKFLALCEEEHVRTISYGNGIPPREAIALFKDGKGTVLVGTIANYGEGVDLPQQLAPVIFVLRPSYPKPTDPAAQFEERRFGSMRWRVWNWRVMIEALQVRGRNIRSGEDLGVTFFISQQFRRFLFASLPEWLQKAYRNDRTLEAAVEETLSLLKGR
jgi:Rad3-related DNA helicase